MFNDTLNPDRENGHLRLSGAQDSENRTAIRVSPEVISRVAPVTGAILEDLEIERQENAKRIRDLEAQAATEKRERDEAARSRRNDLAPTRDEIKHALNKLDEEHAEMREMLQDAASAVEERAELVRSIELERTDDELRQTKADLRALRSGATERRAELEDELTNQEATAARARAEAGHAYPHDDPMDRPKVTDEIVASESGKVIDHSDSDSVPHALAWAVTTISGTAAGFSLGLAAKFLHADTLHREVLLAILCSLFGLGTSTALKFGLESVWREVSLRLHAAKAWIPSATVATLLTTLVVIIYCTVERRGLMAGMLLEAMTNSVRGPKADTSQLQIAATFGSLFLTAPYVLLVSMVGFRKGRYTIHSNFGKARTHRETVQSEANRRGTPEIKNTFAEVSLVAVAQNRITRFNARTNAEMERLNAEIAGLEAKRSSIVAEMVAVPTPRQVQFSGEQQRISAEREKLEARAEGLDTQASKLNGAPSEPTPSEAKLKEAQAQAAYIAARIAHEQEKARIEFELSNGNLLQRLRVALGRRKPTVGTLRHQYQSR